MNLITTYVSDPKPELEAELGRLRLELIELAFELDRRRQPEAADVANGVAVRLAELLPLKDEADA